MTQLKQNKTLQSLILTQIQEVISYLLVILVEVIENKVQYS